MARGIGAVVAAFVLWSLLWLGFNAIASAALPQVIVPEEPLTHPGVLSALLLYAAVISFASGYVCATVRGSLPMKAVWTLALTLLAVGLYGRGLPNQNGAPIRLVVPWKYGFKSIKSVVTIRFTEEQPPTTWNMQAPNEYGFYSNVNPEVDHPRWSQRKERRIGDILKRETLMFNGYADQVASLYSGMDLRKLY